MLVLNKDAALDHLIARAIRQSEVVPEPFAAHTGAEPEFAPIGGTTAFPADSVEERDLTAGVGSSLLGSFWLRGGGAERGAN